jgi:hypothetical protein
LADLANHAWPCLLLWAAELICREAAHYKLEAASLMDQIIDRIRAKPPHQPPYVLEDVQAHPPRKLFTWLGVEWLGTSLWWLALVWIMVLGVLLGFLLAPASVRRVRQKLRFGLTYGGLIAFSVLTHQVGQVLAGRLAGAPMKGVVFTATLAYHIYADRLEYPSSVHLTRALGGPAANLLLGMGALVASRAPGRHPFARFLAALNLAFSLASLTPLPTMDGGAALYELRHWRSRVD